MVDAAKCGVFVEPGNVDALVTAIVELADDPARSQEMGLAGRAYIEENFDRATLAEELTGILEEMVDGD